MCETGHNREAALGGKCTGPSPKSFTTNSNDLPDSVKIFVPNCAKTPGTNKKTGSSAAVPREKAPWKELKVSSGQQNAQGRQQAHAPPALQPIVPRYHGQKSSCPVNFPFDGKACARKTLSFAGRWHKRVLPSALSFGQDICTSGTPRAQNAQDAKGPPLSQVGRLEPSKCGGGFPADG